MLCADGCRHRVEVINPLSDVHNGTLPLYVAQQTCSEPIVVIGDPASTITEIYPL